MNTTNQNIARACDSVGEVCTMSAVREGASEAVAKWIDVTDRLPEIGPDEEGIPVWTWDGVTVEHDEFVANYEQPAGPTVGGWVRTDDWFAGDLESRVTHWQPYSKPAAPTGGESGGAVAAIECTPPSIPQDVLTLISRYGDSRADVDGLSAIRLGEAILAIRRWAATLAALQSVKPQPQGGAE